MLDKTETLYKISVRCIIEPDGNGFHAYAPALPGLHADGDTKEEARDHLEEGIVVYLESLHKHRQPLPVGPDLIVHQTHAPKQGFHQFGELYQDSEAGSQSYPVAQQVTISWPTLSTFGAN